MPNELYIYKIECAANNKKYIGRTQYPMTRRQAHFYALRHNKHTVEDMQADFNKYGEETFSFKVIEVCHPIGDWRKDKEIANSERRWIKYHRSYMREKGYNYKDKMFNHPVEYAPDCVGHKENLVMKEETEVPRVMLDPEYWSLLLKDELKKHRQVEIAEVLGCSQQTVSNKIRNMNFTLPELAKLKRELGLDIEKVVSKF